MGTLKRVAVEAATAIKEVGEDAVEALRLDAYFNLVTGLGGSKDKTSGIGYELRRRFVNSQTVSDLYAGDPLAARIVDSIVDDAMRKGWHIEFSSTNEDGEVEALDSREAAELNAKIKEWEKDVSLHSKIDKWWKRGRAHGGALMLFGVDDGVEDKAESLRPGGTFDWIQVLTRWEVSASVDIGDDPKEPQTFCLPVTYALHPNKVSSELFNQHMHATRVFRYEGVQVDDPISGTTRIGAGDTFGDSIFERVWIPLKNWNSALQGAGHIIQDFAQAVYSVKGFRQVLRAKGGRDILFKQFGVMEQFRSMFNATVVDADDTYERKTTSVAGMPDLIDRFGNHLSASSGMPLTKLIGISPGGFGTGEAEENNWNGIVEAAQQSDLKPVLERIYSVLFETAEFKGKVPDGWKIVFTPLKQMSESDQAEIQNKQAQTDAIYIANGVVTPDEVAQSRFGKGGFSLDTHIDQDGRDEFAEAEEDVGAEIEGAKTAEGTPEAEVAKTAMNGAQVVSLIDIVAKVITGELPKDSAIAIIQVAYQLSKEDAAAIIGSAEFEEPEPEPEPQPVAPNPVEENPSDGEDENEETDEQETGDGEASSSPIGSGEEESAES